MVGDGRKGVFRRMRTRQRTLLLFVVGVVLGVITYKVIAGRQRAQVAATVSGGAEKALPRLLELGSDTCSACKKMEPILAALKQELAGKVSIEFVDVYKQEEYVEKYEIKVIPLQVFLDAEGRELFRHTGVYSKEEILAKMKELGMLR